MSHKIKNIQDTIDETTKIKKIKGVTHQITKKSKKNHLITHGFCGLGSGLPRTQLFWKVFHFLKLSPPNNPLIHFLGWFRWVWSSLLGLPNPCTPLEWISSARCHPISFWLPAKKNQVPLALGLRATTDTIVFLKYILKQKVSNKENKL